MDRAWDDMMDRALFATVQKMGGAPTQAGRNPIGNTWANIADRFNADNFAVKSPDACRHRYTRVLQELERYENQTIILPDDEITPEKRVDYAGFRMGFYDIETTNLGAMMGRVLVVSIADEFGELVTKTYSDFDGKSILDDAPLVEWTMRELDNYDILVTWNGKLFDKPFLNARALKGLVVPLHPLKMHIDLMYQFKGQQARMGSAKMDNVAKALGVQHQKTPLDFSTWERAAVGDQEALAEVVEHCEADVLTMRDIFARSKRLIGNVTR
jgi:uncharacterized protein YprB with RNaseH-like and TPR domain